MRPGGQALPALRRAIAPDHGLALKPPPRAVSRPARTSRFVCGSGGERPRHLPCADMSPWVSGRVASCGRARCRLNQPAARSSASATALGSMNTAPPSAMAPIAYSGAVRRACARRSRRAGRSGPALPRSRPGRRRVATPTRSGPSPDSAARGARAGVRLPVDRGISCPKPASEPPPQLWRWVETSCALTPPAERHPRRCCSRRRPSYPGGCQRLP
jgi:hypothetical protein